MRFAPLPPMTMFAFGTRVVLDEVPVSVNAPPRFHIADGEGQRPGCGVFVGGLVGDVRDRWVVVNGRDGQHKGVAGGAAIGIGDGDVMVRCRTDYWPRYRDGHGALAPLPPNTMFAFGTRVVFDEVPDSVKLAAAVSTSPMVKAIAPVAVSSLVVWLAMSEIVGLSLTDVDRQHKGVAGGATIRIGDGDGDGGGAGLISWPA